MKAKLEQLEEAFSPPASFALRFVCQGLAEGLLWPLLNTKLFVLQVLDF